MRNRPSIVPFVAALAVSGTALADINVFDAQPTFPSPPPGVDEHPQGEWVGQVALGFNASTGNTETSSLNAGVLLGFEQDPWRHAVNFTANRASDLTGTTAERYQLTGKSDYKLNDADFLFAAAVAERDRFAGITLRTSQALGYGRQLMDTERHKLTAEAGVGMRQIRYTDDTRETGAIVRVGGAYVWHISDASEFSQRLVLEAGSSTFTESVTALKTNLIGRIYSNLSFTVKHNDTVPAGRRKTDTFTAIQLEYHF